jgi:hypothetical protein
VEIHRAEEFASEGYMDWSSGFYDPTLVLVDAPLVYEQHYYSYKDTIRFALVRYEDIINPNSGLDKMLDVALDQLKQGMVIYVPAGSVGHDRFIQHAEYPALARWISEFLRVDFGVVNQHNNLINVYWVEPDTNREVINLENLAQQVPQWLTAYVGHKFIARDATNNARVAEFTIKGSSLFVVQEKDVDPAMVCNLDQCDPTNWNDIKKTALRHIWSEGNSTERTRLESNERHPKMFKHFTKLGFEKRKMPKTTYNALSTYWRLNRDNLAVEKWTPGSTFVNHRAHATFMAWLPENGHVKRVIFDNIKPILEEWSGIPKLVPTSFYGIMLIEHPLM